MANYTEVVDAGPGWTKVQGDDGQIYTVEGNRNWRNNNPGNLEYGDFAKSNGAIGTDGRFAVFPSFDAGQQARSDLLFNSPNYSNLTLSQAINRYAPPSENNTNHYLNEVSASSGVDPNTTMSSIPPSQRAAVLDAMQRVEGWKVGSINGSPAPAPIMVANGANVPVNQPRIRNFLPPVNNLALAYASAPPGTPATNAINGAIMVPRTRVAPAGNLMAALGGAISGGFAPIMRAAQNGMLNTVEGRTALMRGLVNNVTPVGGVASNNDHRDFGSLNTTPENMNMDVYRANAAAAGGGGNLNSAGIAKAIASGAIMRRA